MTWVSQQPRLTDWCHHSEKNLLCGKKARQTRKYHMLDTKSKAPSYVVFVGFFLYKHEINILKNPNFLSPKGPTNANISSRVNSARPEQPPPQGHFTTTKAQRAHHDPAWNTVQLWHFTPDTPVRFHTRPRAVLARKIMTTQGLPCDAAAADKISSNA